MIAAVTPPNVKKDKGVVGLDMLVFTIGALFLIVMGRVLETEMTCGSSMGLCLDVRANMLVSTTNARRLMCGEVEPVAEI